MTAEMLSVDDARRRVLDAVHPVADEVLFLPAAAGRVLAEELTSRRDLPAVDNSAMDGVGVRVDDVKAASKESPVRLRLLGEQLPGGPATPALSSGTAVRIMTGAPIPPGVEAVVMRELCDEREVAQGFVGVLEAAAARQNIRAHGEDVAEGDVVGRAGDEITPARLNLLLAAGHVSARVRRRPVVALLASGDELVDVGHALTREDVVNSNAHAVAAAARALGCDVHLLGIARDSLDDHVKKIEAGLACDALLTIGGVSMGTHDFVRPALEKLGATVELWKVAMRPGKPLAFARFAGVDGGPRVFGLPGNPVSALVSFELFVRPALDKMRGLRGKPRPLWPAVLVDGALPKKPGLEVYARGSARLAGGRLEVRPLEGQGSHQVSVLARANALVRLPPESAGARAGDAVEVILLQDPLTAADML